MANNSRSKTVAKNTGIMFGRMILLMAIGLFTAREVLRILGVSDFGIYNLVGTIVVMFTFLQTALNNATSRYITYDLGKGDSSRLSKTFSMSVNSEILLAAVIVILTEAIGPWFIEHKLNIPENRLFAAHCVFQLSLLSSVIGIMRTPFNSTIIAHERFDYFAYSSIIEAIAKLLILYFITVSSIDKLITYAILQVFVAISIFLWMIIYCWRNFEETHYRRCWETQMLKYLTKYSGLSLLVNMIDVAVLQSFGIFFNLFCGVVANAALGIANQVNAQLNNFLQNFSQSYRPQIIKSYAAGDNRYFMNLLFSAGKLAYFLYFALAFPIMLNIDYILSLWLEEVPENTGLFICLIIGYSLLDSFSEPLWCSVHATGNLKVHQLLMGGIKLMNIPISFCLLKLGFPIYFVLVVYVTMNLMCTIVRIWWMTHLIQLNAKQYCKEVIWNIVKITIVALPIPIVLKCLIGENNFYGLIFESIVFWIIYATVIYNWALNEKERAIFNQFKSKILLISNKNNIKL